MNMIGPVTWWLTRAQALCTLSTCAPTVQAKFLGRVCHVIVARVGANVPLCQWGCWRVPEIVRLGELAIAGSALRARIQLVLTTSQQSRRDNAGRQTSFLVALRTTAGNEARTGSGLS
ncbi:hypothetical protein EDB89DRAFT_1903254 [Lactarius sanguifluus]|nr:hypothetical protein EDB89DRAFT_1903254 [Lactarius sanguifluus]